MDNVIKQWQIYELSGAEFLIKYDKGESWGIEYPHCSENKDINKQVLADAVKLGDAVHQTNPPLKVGDEVIWGGRKYGSCSDDDLFFVGEKYSVAGFHHDNNDDVEIEQYIDGRHLTIRATPTETKVGANSPHLTSRL